MPSWLIKILIEIALTIGLPPFLEWLMKKFPWLPRDVVDKLVEIIKKYLEAIEGVKDRTAIKALKREARRECRGVACPPSLKK